MIELLVLCVLYALIWGVVVPVVEYTCLSIVYLSLLVLFVFEALTRQDCSWLKEKGLKLYQKLRYRV